MPSQPQLIRDLTAPQPLAQRVGPLAGAAAAAGRQLHLLVELAHPRVLQWWRRVGACQWLVRQHVGTARASPADAWQVGRLKRRAWQAPHAAWAAAGLALNTAYSSGRRRHTRDANSSSQRLSSDTSCDDRCPAQRGWGGQAGRDVTQGRKWTDQYQRISTGQDVAAIDLPAVVLKPEPR